MARVVDREAVEIGFAPTGLVQVEQHPPGLALAVTALGLVAAVALTSASPISAPAAAQEDEFVPRRPGQLEDPGTPRFNTSSWDTDFSISAVPYDEIFSGGPGKDGIPAINDPRFESIGEARAWVTGRGPVIALEIDGDARAWFPTVAAGVAPTGDQASMTCGETRVLVDDGGGALRIFDHGPGGGWRTPVEQPGVHARRVWPAARLVKSGGSASLSN